MSSSDPCARLVPGGSSVYNVPACAAQVNLDFGSERDMVEKFRIGLALQPIAQALFANSPFKEGKPTGWVRGEGGRGCSGKGWVGGTESSVCSSLCSTQNGLPRPSTA